ncbi:hypothetical protein SJAV_04330 [Sulfurisphaera javensis]|uniref:Transcriptional regulator n=1 Tax=Sulfurisphaera javensis TaxID=2049879 RepID=A0AAT9GP66_9CREN
MRILPKKIIVPCEVAVKDVIPAIKALIATELSARGFSQKEIAEILTISIAEVNYLLKGKRGDEQLKKILSSDADFMDLLNSFTQKIVSNDNGADPLSLCILCSYARRKILKQEQACPYDIS